MTTAAPQLADTAQQNTAQLQALEVAVAAAATAGLAAALTSALRATTTAWLRAVGTLADTPGRPGLEALLRETRRRIAEAMAGQGRIAQQIAADGARRAVRLGVQQGAAFAFAASGTPPPVPPAPPLDDEVRAALADMPAHVEEQRSAAMKALTMAAVAAVGWAGITAAFGVARRSITRLAAAASVALGAALRAGVQAVASAIDQASSRRSEPTLLMWVAEPTSCLACAAYSGRTIRPDEKFPGGLSLNPDKTVFATAIPGPPRHPHCRCVLVPWRQNWAQPGPQLAAVLRQRARRTP